MMHRNWPAGDLTICVSENKSYDYRNAISNGMYLSRLAVVRRIVNNMVACRGWYRNEQDTKESFPSSVWKPV